VQRFIGIDKVIDQVPLDPPDVISDESDDDIDLDMLSRANQKSIRQKQLEKKRAKVMILIQCI
jgi:hypothetical protein